MNDYGYYDYGYATTVEETNSLVNTMATMSLVVSLFSIVISVITIVSMWKIFKKAGKKGWEAIIPIYNIIVLLQIVDLPTWYIILFFIPFANIYIVFKIYITLAHKFGKSTGFGVGLVFLNFVFMPMLAFGNNTYQGNNSQTNYTNQSAININQQNAYYQPQSQQVSQQNAYYQPQSQQVSQQNTYSQTQQMPQQNMNSVPVQNVQNQEQLVQNNNIQSGSTPIINQNNNVQSNTNFQQPVQSNLTEKVCPKCGNKVEASNSTCFMCGYKF